MRNRLNSFAARFIGVLAVVFCFCNISLAAVYRVSPSGTGDGSSWAQAMSITAAISAAAAGDEIHCQAGTYPVAASIAIAKATTIKGGYAGDDDEDEKLDASGALSVFDGQEASAVTKIFNVTTGSKATNTNWFERIEVTRGYERGLYKNGIATLVLKNCRITRCGRVNTGNYNGHGLYCYGGNGPGPAILENCVFAENRYEGTTNQKNMGYGFGGYFENMKRVTIDGAYVVSNGLAKTRANGLDVAQDGFWGAAFYLKASPLTLVNSEFRANLAGINGGFGGVVRLEGSGDNNVISNCLFAGNAVQKTHGAGNDTTSGAVLSFDLNAFSRKVDVVNCTFAYNLTDGYWTPADVSVTKATAKFRNCIFWGAFYGTHLKSGQNIHVADGAKADIDYCLFAAKDATYVSAITSTDLTLGDHIVVGDPCFKTSRSALESYARLYTHSDKSVYYGYDTTRFNDIMAIDAHVNNTSGNYSRAIDTGDASSYANEPAPNGSCINLGYYGNTSGAATSAGGVPAFESGYPKVTFAADTRAIVTVKLAAGTVCNACVTIDVGGEHYSVSGVQPGETVTFQAKSLNAVGATVTAEVSVSAAGLASALTASPSGTVTGTPPAWYGHGGGANVIHVRAGADGRKDGSDWHNAFDSMFDAMLYLSTHSEKTEMWIAGTVVATAASVERKISSATFAFRGGFTGVEDYASERVAGVKSTLDGNDSYASLEFSNANPVRIERLVFKRSGKSGVKKTGGAGDVTVADCVFQDNVNDNSGEGCSFTGTAAATISVTNCLFANNRAKGNQTSPAGRAIYANTLKRVFVDDTLFTTNGSRISVDALGNQDGKNGCDGGVIYATAAPLTVRNCEFRANRSPIRGVTGGIIRLNGASAPTAFTNCVFTGNQNTFGESDIYMTDRNYTPNGGVFVLTLANATDVVELSQCTVAYNLTDAYQVPGCAAVLKGTFKARNTIFYKNVWGPMTCYPNEIYLHADGYADLDYVWVTDKLTSLGAADASHYTLGTLYDGDPSFVTPTATFEPLIQKKETNGYTYQWLDKSAAGQRGQLALDVHLLSPKGYWKNDGLYYEDAATVSEAIDKGDPASPYALEPNPNGGRANLGVYGGTSKASKTSVVTPIVNGVTVDCPNGYTQPRVCVEMSAASPTDIYSATVTISCYTGAVAGVGTTFTNVYQGVGNGTTITNWVPWCYQAGVPVHVDVKVEATGVSAITDSASGTVTGEVSPSFGKGGGTDVVHVRLGATGFNDGSDWFHAYADLATAILNVGAKREIWVARAGGTFRLLDVLNINSATLAAFRGGFAGTEENAAARDGQGHTVFDAQGTQANALRLANVTDLAFDGFDFVNGTEHGLCKTGNGGITLVDCGFRCNGAPSTQISGRGAYLEGSSAAAAVVTNCVFAGNVQMPGGGNNAGEGLGLYVKTFASFTMDDTLFVTNGAALDASYASSSPGRDGFKGSALYINGVSSTVRRCQFRANRATTRESNRGGCVWVAGAANGSVFENCLWVGNWENCGWNNICDGTAGGALVVNLANKTDEVTVRNATIAYNRTAQRTASAGISVVKGVLNLTDSIVYGNTTLSDRTVGCDLALTTSDGAANVSYTLLTSNETTYVSGASLTLGDGVQYGDPSFVTSQAAADALVVKWNFSELQYTNDLNQVQAMDVHLRSKAGYWRNDGTYVASDETSSRGIDVGDPESAYANEPDPNGHRVNLGAYGNTAQASKSSVGQPEIASIVAACVDPYTRPRVTVNLTAEDPDADYKASVEIVISTGGVEVVRQTISGVVNGGAAVCHPPVYLKPDGTFNVAVTVTSAGAVTRNDTRTDVPVTGELPPWFGRGGPANVIHVRQDADGRGTGLDWADAYADIGLAVAALSAERNEIWIAGTISVMNQLAAFSPSVPLVIRGGFDGSENTPAERKASALSTLDYKKATDGLSVNASVAVTVERMVFTNTKSSSAFVKTGAGDSVFRDCVFRSNARNVSGDIDGRGLRVTGTAGVTLVTVTNCVFAENGLFESGERYGGRGLGAYFADCLRVTIDDCLFASNSVGLVRSQDANWGGDKTLGTAIYATSAPLTVRNTRFVANIGVTRQNGYNSGGIVRLQGNGSGTVFTNCLFIGNYERCGWAGDPGSHGGTVVVELSDASQTVGFESCTMAYNLLDGKIGSAGVHVLCGRVTAHNSIFFGNLRNKYLESNGCGADVHVAAGSSFAANYCLFTDTTSNSVSKVSGATATCAASCLYGDPLFVTPTNDYLALTAYNGKYRYYNATFGQLGQLNVHLRSRAGYIDASDELVRFRGKSSPAIDAGDPASAWTNEPEVNGVGGNGRRINLGYYGNTCEATLTPVRGAFLRVR